jgi:hypothetical protein
MSGNQRELAERGTWFLSYLCMDGFLDDWGEVFNGHVCGNLAKDYFGLPAGTRVNITIVDKTTYRIEYASEEDIRAYYKQLNDGYVSGDDDCEWYQDMAKVKYVNLEINFTEREVDG